MISIGIYWLIIEFYELGIILYSFVNLKAKKLRQGRSRWIVPLKAGSLLDSSNSVWVHSASLGEFEQAKPIIASLKNSIPNLKIIVSFFSPSGFEIRRNDPLIDIAFYLPKDTTHNARRLYDLTKPSFVVFIKYEFWKNFLEEGNRREIPIYLISGIFRRQQVFFQWYGALHRRMLSNFRLFFLQNESSNQLLNSIGFRNSIVTGDTRFDQVATLANTFFESEKLKQFCANYKILIAGSVWEEDMDRIIPLINSSTQLRFIIAPHEITSTAIDRYQSRIKKKSILFSDDDSAISSADVMIIDSIGLLSKIYRYGDIAFIGGAYGPGLHNTLEAVAYGLPVFFGNKNYLKYQEANDLIKLGIGRVISSPEQLTNEVNELVSNNSFLEKQKAKAKEYVGANRGSTKSIVTHILNNFERPNS